MKREGYGSDPEVGYFGDEVRSLFEERLPQLVVFLFNLQDLFTGLFVQPVNLILNLVNLFYRLLLFFICHKENSVSDQTKQLDLAINV